MKARFFLFFLISLLFTSCVSYPLMLNKSFPSGDKYKILGSVSCTGTTIRILGIPFGGTTFAALFSAAHAKYKSVDDVVSVSVDREVRTVLGIITWVDTTLRGIAIRYIDPPSASDGAKE